MRSIPQEIEEDILVRLPVKSILRFKSVCKSWYTLLCSPKFVNHHLTFTSKNPRLMIRNTSCLLEKDIFYSVDYSSIFSASSSSTACKCEGAVLMKDPDVVSTRYIQFFGSCNGLLCLGVNQNRKMILWNPNTRGIYKKIILPSYFCSPTIAGFGYDTLSNKYKLVCMADNVVFVCTVESFYIWRTVGTAPCKHFSASAGLLLNGVLYWLGTIFKHGSSKAIVAFNISSEQFVNMHFPEETIMLHPYGSCNLKVLGDSLCLVCGVPNVRLDVWVLQNYGVTESWVKKFTTTQEQITSLPSFLKFFCIFENGEILVHTYKGFILYDQEKDRFRLLNINGNNDRLNSIESESYVESLVSPTCNRNLCI